MLMAGRTTGRTRQNLQAERATNAGLPLMPGCLLETHQMVLREEGLGRVAVGEMAREGASRWWAQGWRLNRGR